LFACFFGQEDRKGTKAVSATQELYVSRALELVKEMRGKGIPPNQLTYKPIMTWLAEKGRIHQFQELAKCMAEDGVPFDGVFKYYEIQMLLQSRNFDRAKALYLAAKNTDQKLPPALDGEYVLRTLSSERNVSGFDCSIPRFSSYKFGSF